MKKVGLFFGTFNPIHVGHLIIANYMACHTDLDEVWLVVTPQNPFKQKSSLLPDYHRLMIAQIAVEDNEKVKVSNVEFKLPKPSYTINTLVHLKENYPKINFSLLMGEDNLRSLHKWKNYELILKNHDIYVYPRVLTDQEKEDLKGYRTNPRLVNHPRIIKVDAPVMKLSASFIRKSIKEGLSVKYLLTENVLKYIDEMHFYK